MSNFINTITDIRVYKLESSGNIKGLASITIAEEFVIGNIKIIEHDSNLFIGMPSYKNSKGEYTDICFPLNKEVRDQLQNKIIEKYNSL